MYSFLLEFGHQTVYFFSSLTQNDLPNSVYTGVVIWHKNQIHKFTEVTTVYMAPLTPEEVRAYVETGEPM